jgi:hypothetical protein
MQVGTTTPQTSRELLAVGPDMAKVLTVVALRKSSLSSVWFYLDDIVTCIMVHAANKTHSGSDDWIY